MIRRVSKNCDLRDYIKSCPSGVIDDIYKIEYYVQGNNVVIECSFTKVGDTLDVVIPTSQLGLLPNGILMRRAYYKVVDTSYPDGYYNLEFEDCMNIWLGDYESEEPIIPEYVTEEELASELTSYATKDWVDSQQFLTSDSLSDYMTESAIENLGFATESWVLSQGYLTSVPEGYATEQFVTSEIIGLQSWVIDQGYITSGNLPSGLATQSWVQSQGYLTSVPSEYATKSWVSENIRLVQDYASDLSLRLSFVVSDVSDLSSAVGDLSSTVQGYDDQFSEIYSLVDDKPSYGDLDNLESGMYEAIDGVYSYIDERGYATEQFVTDSLSDYATEQFVTDSLSVYATESWVESQGYLTSVPEGYATEQFVTDSLSGYATESWVSSNFLSSVPDTYATKSWVSSQQFATESWVSAQDFLEESKVWCGTRSQWERLTSEEQAAYKIALVTA